MIDRVRSWASARIVSRWWAEFNVDGPEIDWFKQFVEAGQPALDAACGTGRLLVPYLEAGLDVDGSDISPDMLACVRERCEREDLPQPNLYPQAMHELDLPRRYRTIIVCGGFGLGGHREHDVEGLRRLYEHLEPGGTLVLDNEVPYADTVVWPYWLKEKRQELPRPWGDRYDRRTGADGTAYTLRSRIVDVDGLAQSVTLDIRATMQLGDEPLTEEEGRIQMTMYFTPELELLLEGAGFVDIEVRGALSDREPTPDDDFVVFIARKPASVASV